MPQLPEFDPRVPIRTGTGGRLSTTPADEKALQDFGGSLVETGSALWEFANKQQDANETNKAHALLLRAQENIEARLDALKKQAPGSYDYRVEAQRIINEEYSRAAGESSGMRPKARSFLLQKSREGRLRAVIEAGDTADEIFIDENKSAIEIMLPKLRERVARARTPREYQSALDSLNSFIDSQIGIGFTREAAERERNKLMREIKIERIKAMAIHDPVGAMIAVGEDKSLPLKDSTALQKYAESRLSTLNNLRDRQERREEKELEDRLDSMEASFFQQIQQGEDIRAEVQELTDVLGAQRAKRILDFQRELEENRRKGVKSNPDTLLRVSTWVNGGIDPETGEERLPTVDEIRQLGAEGKLSATHVGFFQQQVASKRKASSKEAETLRNRLVRAGQRRINAALRSSGIIDRFDPNAQRARAMALREYQEITLREPKSDPLSVADEVIGRYVKAIFDQGAIYNKKLMNAAPTTHDGRVIDNKKALLGAVENGEVDERVAEVWFDVFEFIEQQQALQGSPAQKQKQSKQEEQGFDLGAWLKDFFKDKPRLSNQSSSGR